jgi:hypothetical protein
MEGASFSRSWHKMTIFCPPITTCHVSLVHQNTLKPYRLEAPDHTKFKKKNNNWKHPSAALPPSPASHRAWKLEHTGTAQHGPCRHRPPRTTPPNCQAELHYHHLGRAPEKTVTAPLERIKKLKKIVAIYLWNSITSLPNETYRHLRTILHSYTIKPEWWRLDL